MASKTPRAVAIILTAALAAGGFFAAAAPAAAVPATLVVTATSDGDGNDACTDSSVFSPAAVVTLRNALCVADNRGGSQTVTVPSGTYALSSGPLVIGTRPGLDLTVNGAGAAATTIDAGGLSQAISIDPDLGGDVSVTVNGVTVANGLDNSVGGAGIIAGSGDAAVGDTLVVSNSAFTGNRANTAGASTNQPGGAIQFIGGSLTVTNTRFSGNNSGSSAGGAISYQAQQGVSGQQLSISTSTFTANTATAADPAANGGGAIVVVDTAGDTPMSIDASTFAGNGVVGAAGQAHGGAIWHQSGTLSVTASAFTGNTVTGAGSGASAIESAGGRLTASYNRFAGNTAPALSVPAGATRATMNASENWWGCAGGPGASGCDTAVAASAITSPSLTLTVTAASPVIIPPATTTPLTASLLVDSAGGAVPAASLGAFQGLTVGWSNASPSGASLSATGSAIAAGVTTVTYDSRSLTGPGSARASLDSAQVAVPVGLGARPSFTSPAVATSVVGTAGTFTVATSGYPAAAITLTAGSLPSGVTLADNHDGTATLRGTPAPGTGGDYALGLSASNVVGGRSQSLTLHVQQTPGITSADHVTFAGGAASSFTVTSSGVPTPSPLTETGALPQGVSFTDNGNGTATLAGRPAAGTGGVYQVTLTAANGVGSDAVQSFALTVTEAPRFTGGTALSAAFGVSSSLTVTTAPGYPVSTTIALTDGALPAGLAFADNGDGSATFSGTPTVAGVFTVTLSATNTSGSVSRVFTVEVDRAPEVTLGATDQTVGAGDTAAFTAAASGFPAPTLQWQVSTDAGAHWADLSGEIGNTLSFTARQADDGNRYRAVFANSAGTAYSEAALTVRTQPSFSSAAAATFAAGAGPQSATVTTTAFPPASLATGSTLPSWLAFTDNGDGTASIAGAPPATAGGLYPIHITAGNGFMPDAAQDFVLTVTEKAAFTSAPSTAFAVGTGGSFTVTTASGFPVATSITESGALPSGVDFTDRGDGTATFSGTPAAGTGGVYRVTLTASNGTAPDATQSFELTVAESAAFTSAASVSITRGVDVDAAITTGHAYPAVSSLSLVGSLPAGLNFTDNGDGTASVSGSTTAAAGTDTVRVVAHAPGQPDVEQPFALVIADAPAIAMPLLPPAGSGPLTSVPATAEPGQQVTLSADGFAAGAPITFAIYSSPTVLAVVNADAAGSATATVTIPAGLTGTHTLVASGVAPDGTDRFVRSAVVLPPADGGPTGPGGGPGSGGPGSGGGPVAGGPGSGGPVSGTVTDPGASASGGLPDTGSDVGGALLIALLLVVSGSVIALRRLLLRRPR